MSQAYKKMHLRLLLLNKLIVVFLFFTSCSTAKIVHEEHHLTDREVMYEKGLSLFNAAKYFESSAFFLKLSQNPTSDNDELYNLSLWNLSLIYEKFGEFEKAALALQELQRRRSTKLSLFNTQLGLMKNYIRLHNKKVALEIKIIIDASAPTEGYGVN